MIAVYCFYPGDEKQALKNARWMNELGGCHGHEMVCAFDPRCNPGVVEEIRVELLKSFDRLHRCPATGEVDGWPAGANYFFRLCATWLQDKEQWPYFLWLEPDAIAMTPGWMDFLEAEHKRGGKLFTGDRVQVLDVPLHMSGVGIYPNPLHAHAGEAYRAHDVAWDVAAKDQIVPRAHFTDLIEHAWKHPAFTNKNEVATQIAPETILFHASKDGSLIDLLQQNAALETYPHSVPTEPTSGLPSREEIGTRAAQPTPPVYDIFIRTYPADYEWLRFCLDSISKFAKGFRKLWIVTPGETDSAKYHSLQLHDGTLLDAQWKQMADESPVGYMAQQITKLYADVITDYQADYLLHIDSDTVFTRPCQPDYFFRNNKIIWYYEPYPIKYRPPWANNDLLVHWQPITELFMNEPVPFEFMRRLPMMMPGWLYPRLREFCHKTHGQVISDYINVQPPRMFSEFNALGAYAFKYHHDKFEWVNTAEDPMQEPVAKQFPGWTKLTPDVISEIETYLNGADSQTPNVGTRDAELPTEIGSENPPGSAPQLKELPNGLWVLEGDQISQWVEQEGRLDHDQYLLGMILPHIKEGDCVVDIGAHIGDHTIAYIRAAGIHGVVHAFEPNPVAMTCLKHNVSEVLSYAVALGDKSGELVPLSDNNMQPSGAYIGEFRKIGNVMMRRLDDYPEIKPNLIKMDVEGYEPKVLDGAEKMIRSHHPIMVLEVNETALKRQGFTREDIFSRLESLGYDYTIMQPDYTVTSPMYDILATPRFSPLTPYGEITAAVALLKNFADAGSDNRYRVMMGLSRAGLTPRWKPKKNAKTKPSSHKRKPTPA